MTVATPADEWGRQITQQQKRVVLIARRAYEATDEREEELRRYFLRKHLEAYRIYSDRTREETLGVIVPIDDPYATSLLFMLEHGRFGKLPELPFPVPRLVSAAA